jgi:imidazolonepropionase-like amidohydrolase
MNANHDHNTTVLRNLRIWDGTGWADADSICVQGQRIAALEAPADQLSKPTVIDCAGAVAIPGLMDAHVHMELNPEHSKPPAHTDLNQQPQMEKRAREMVEAGITTARDLGGGAWLELKLRDRIAAGTVPGPRLICAGQPITSPGGHCHFWGGEAADLEQARGVLERQVSQGVDLIKVMASGGRMTKGSDPLKPQFDLETLRGIVARATDYGLPVAAHCHGTGAIEHAAKAGVSTIEHCSWVGKDGWASDYQEDIARVILERGVWVSPTINRGWQRMLDSKTGAVLARVRAAYGAMLEMGIPFVASTDAGIPGVFHHHLPEALGVFSRIAGLTNADTLRSATSDAARALGMSAITGRLAPGLAADILVLDGDPLEDIAALTRPVGIWANGRAVRLP